MYVGFSVPRGLTGKSVSVYFTLYNFDRDRIGYIVLGIFFKVAFKLLSKLFSKSNH